MVDLTNALKLVGIFDIIILKLKILYFNLLFSNSIICIILEHFDSNEIILKLGISSKLLQNSNEILLQML